MEKLTEILEQIRKQKQISITALRKHLRISNSVHLHSIKTGIIPPTMFAAWILYLEYRYEDIPFFQQYYDRQLIHQRLSDGIQDESTKKVVADLIYFQNELTTQTKQKIANLLYAEVLHTIAVPPRLFIDARSEVIRKHDRIHAKRQARN